MENLKELSDGALATLAGHGNNRAFDKLMLRYGNPLLNYICNNIRDRDAAKDIAQDTWEVALRYVRRKKYTESGRLKNMLHTVALRKVFKWRKKKNLYIYSVIEIAEPPNEAMVREEKFRQMNQWIGKLRKIHRLVLRMRIEFKFSYDKIAARLHISEDYARQLFVRAKGELKKMAAVNE